MLLANNFSSAILFLNRELVSVPHRLLSPSPIMGCIIILSHSAEKTSQSEREEAN